MSIFRSFERALLLLLLCLVVILLRRVQLTSILSKEPGSIVTTAPGCVPHVPSSLLSEEAILEHPAVLQALSELNSKLQSLVSWKKDAVSISVVHGAAGEIFSFHHGRTKMNETSLDKASNSPGGRRIDGDSIYRIASVTKTFVVLEGLILSERSRHQDAVPRLTLDTRVKDILPEFSLPESYAVAEKGITLAMLGSHRAGLTRDLDFFVIEDLSNVTFPLLAHPGASHVGVGHQSSPEQQVLGADHHAKEAIGSSTFEGLHGRLSPDTSMDKSEREYLRLLKRADLVFKVGEMPSYSNAGFNVLGFALEAYHRSVTNKSAFFSDLATTDIIDPLGMNHSFFSPIPTDLKEYVTVPGVDNYVDNLHGPTDDPAGGIFSSSNDLATFLHRVLLSPEPSLISPAQRQTWLRPSYIFPDGKTSVGMPWEINTLKQFPDAPTYQGYTKGGMLPGHYSLISTVPELGYGVVTLLALGCSQPELANGTCNETSTAELDQASHDILAPAILKAYQDTLTARYTGTWTSTNTSSARPSEAVLEFHDGTLWLKKLETSDGTDLLMELDTLFWRVAGKRARKYDDAAKLWGTGFQGVFRAVDPRGCNWYGFDMFYSLSKGGLDKISFEKDPATGELELVHELLGLRLRRVKT